MNGDQFRRGMWEEGPEQLFKLGIQITGYVLPVISLITRVRKSNIINPRG